MTEAVGPMGVGGLGGWLECGTVCCRTDSRASRTYREMQ